MCGKCHSDQDSLYGQELREERNWLHCTCCRFPWHFLEFDIPVSQLADFGPMFPRHSVLETLVPLSLDLCTDPVAEVRSAAIGQVGSLFAMLLQTEAQVPAGQSAVALLLGTVCGMASMQSCYKRANFVHICSSLIHSLEVELINATRFSYSAARAGLTDGGMPQDLGASF